MRYLIRNYNESGEFEVEALTYSRLRKLIEAECHDRNWIVDDTWAERIDKPEANSTPLTIKQLIEARDYLHNLPMQSIQYPSDYGKWVDSVKEIMDKKEAKHG